MDTTIGPGAGGAASGGGAWEEDRKVRFGMLLYVLADVALGIFFFASYVWLRAYNTGGGWRLKDIGPDPQTTLILTALIAASALAYFVAYLGAVTGRQWALRIAIALALALVVANLIGTVNEMRAFNFVTQDGSFASVYLLLTGYHIYHMILAVILGIGVTVRALQGRYSADRHLGVSTVGYYWYWACSMAVALWLLIIILPPQL